MNNICCYLSPQTTCYYCQALWCSTCWSAAFKPKPWNFTICPEGAWPGRHGGHYTMDYSSGLYRQSEVEAFKIMPRQPTE